MPNSGSTVGTGSRQNRQARRGAPLLLAAVCAGAVLSTGCRSGGNTDLEHELQLARETIARQNDELAAQKATIDALHEHVDTIRKIKPADLEKIFCPETLEIGRLSGGYDNDDRPGDDGVVVYLQPKDRAGDVLKVAGEIRIQLYDLAAPAARNLIGEYVIPIDQARELWYGKLMTLHYTVRCPWLHGPPEHPEITIQATFVDYLTQRVISAQRTCTVRLPP